MATFNYKAKTTSGEIVTGKFDATDQSMVITLLRSKGLFPINIIETKMINKDIEISFLKKKITLRDLSIFCRQFYTMLNAGVAIINCLELLKKQTENAQFAQVIGKVYENVQKGMSLSDSMKLHKEIFRNILISMVEIGEISGTLDIVLNRLATHFEKENKIKQKVKSAMTYPAIIGSISIIMVGVLVTFIAPKFIGMMAVVGGELPKPTKMLIAFSDNFKNIPFDISLISIIILIILTYKKLRKMEKGRFFLDSILLKMPLIGSNIKKILASRFTRSLSLLLKTGVPLIQTLELVGNLVENEIINRGMIKVKDEIRRGSNLAGPLEEIGVFPAMVIHMINIGEESGTLDETIGKVADFYDDELELSISRLIALIEPLMMVFLAIIIGGVVIAMILPVFQMQKNIGM